MKKFNRLLYSNKFFAFLMLLVQIVVFVFMFKLSDYTRLPFVGSVLISAVLIIYEINRTGEATFKLTWVLIIAIIPVFGALFYIFTRISGVAHRLGDDYSAAMKINRKYLVQNENVIKEIELIGKSEGSFARYLSRYGGSPAFSNTSVMYYPLGDSMFEDIKKELLKAKKFIFMEFFIINSADRMWNEVFDILKQKAKEGVKIRLMYDAMGCLTTIPRHFDEEIRAYGIKCHVFSPLMPLFSTHQNNRDHRKIIVIDGAVAFNGGINLADEYINEKQRFGHWKDTGYKLTGAAVAGFTGLFLDMWNINSEIPEDGGEYISESLKYYTGETGFVIPFGDTPTDNLYIGKRAYIHNLNNASDYVYIMTPYLVIDDEMYESMKFAAQRGVDVRIIMPHIPDKKYAFYLARTYYKELLEAGIKIYEYTDGFIHAKMSVSDGTKAIVGTINHDYRSLYLHYECASYMENVPAILDIEADFKDTLDKSQEITIPDLKKFKLHTRILGHIIRLVAPLM